MHTLIYKNTWGQFWNSKRTAYLAGRNFLDTHRKELCGEANDRKKKIDRDI